MIKFLLRSLLIALLGLAPFMVAQSTPTPKTDAVSPAPEVFNDLENLALEQLKTEAGLAQQAQGKLARDLQSFQKEVEKTHPGYAFDPNKGLVKKEVKEVKPVVTDEPQGYPDKPKGK